MKTRFFLSFCSYKRDHLPLEGRSEWVFLLFARGRGMKKWNKKKKKKRNKKKDREGENQTDRQTDRNIYISIHNIRVHGRPHKGMTYYILLHITT